MRRGEQRTQESALQQSKGAQRISFWRGLARAGPTRARAARIDRAAEGYTSVRVRGAAAMLECYTAAKEPRYDCTQA